MPVTTASEQADLLERIDGCLGALSSRSTDRRRGRERR